MCPPLFTLLLQPFWKLWEGAGQVQSRAENALKVLQVFSQNEVNDFMMTVVAVVMFCLCTFVSFDCFLFPPVQGLSFLYNPGMKLFTFGCELDLDQDSKSRSVCYSERSPCVLIKYDIWLPYDPRMMGNFWSRSDSESDFGSYFSIHKCLH